MSSRREFLKIAGTFIAGLAVGGGTGYALSPKKEVVVGPAPPAEKEKTLKAAWIYVGPIGDLGWTHAHDVGRREAEKAFNWLETDKVENITEEKTEGAIEQFINKGYQVIFTTSFDHMNPTYKQAERNPDIIFFHCSGYRRRANMGTYFADLYQVYYLNGLMAGALTKTKKVGYVAAHLIPEVIRHINAFTIGISEINPDVEVYVIRLGEWFAPELAREAASTLVEQFNVDVLAFTEDSPATIQYAQELFDETGKKVYVFSHYSPMYKFGKDVVVSGQLVRWGIIYKDILAKVYAGLYTSKNLEKVDYWYLLNTSSVDVGANTYYDELWINPAYKAEFTNISVTDKYTGETLTLMDFISRRYEQMKDVNPTFDPFTGPLRGKWWLGDGGTVLGKKYATGDVVEIPTGVRLGHDDLWNMGWFLENVIVQE